MSAIRSDSEARAYVADLSARIAEQTARNQRASEFLDWVTAMLWIGFVFVPMTVALALHFWVLLVDRGDLLNALGLFLALVSPFAGVAATAGVIYILGGPGSPQHLRPRR
jgi:hypothetical protein